MKTHNLKDLASIAYPKTAFPPIHVGKWKPGSRFIQSVTYEDGDIAAILIPKGYKKAIEYNKKRIDEQFKALYGKPLFFKEKITSTLILRIKEIMELTGKSLKDIAADFRAYIGQNCSFFREENGRQIPIDSQRIMDAYTLIQQAKPVEEVEKILYN